MSKSWEILALERRGQSLRWKESHIDSHKSRQAFFHDHADSNELHRFHSLHSSWHHDQVEASHILIYIMLAHAGKHTAAISYCNPVPASDSNQTRSLPVW